MGIIGVGFLAILTLAGSAAYAFAETFSWNQGLDKSIRGARHFYRVLIFSILLGITVDFLKVHPVKALFWTAVINGVLATIFARRNFDRCVRRQTDARTTELITVANRGWDCYAGECWRGRRNVSSVVPSMLL